LLQKITERLSELKKKEEEELTKEASAKREKVNHEDWFVYSENNQPIIITQLQPSTIVDF